MPFNAPPLFEFLTGEDNLWAIWHKRADEVARERLQPYSDLLLENIVWPHVLANKADILARLKEKCATAQEAYELHVPIWSFSHVHDYPRRIPPVPSIGHGILLERGDEQAKKAQMIHENGWRQWVNVEDADEMGVLQQATIWHIIKKTNFCAALAARFGFNFWTSLSPKEVIEETDPSGVPFARYTYSLNLCFFPHGLTQRLKKQQDEFFRMRGEKAERVLLPGEKMTLWLGEGAERIFYGPPLPVRPVALLRHCHCGCGEDDE
jgi:hypothetical protein